MDYEGKVYGSGATVEKLDAHRRYADAFTRALQSQPSKDNLFTLHYLDAFAGRGDVLLPGSADIAPGSAVQALEVRDRPFDRLLFIDADQSNCEHLEALILARKDDGRATIRRGDANEEIPKFCTWLRGPGGRMARAFVFIDPFAMQISWETIEAIASTRRADMLMLFPLMALRRNLKREDWPNPEHQTALNRFFGGDSWRELYSVEGESVVRMGGDKEITDLYVTKMREHYADVVDPGRTLGSADDGSLFTMLFGCSNPSAAGVAGRIARGVFEAAQGVQHRMRL